MPVWRVLFLISFRHSPMCAVRENVELGSILFYFGAASLHYVFVEN
jgi:hypothetical protein